MKRKDKKMLATKGKDNKKSKKTNILDTASYCTKNERKNLAKEKRNQKAPIEKIQAETKMTGRMMSERLNEN